MQVYSQRDPRWAQDKLGLSSLTMGRYGCTTTSISMLSTYFGDNLDPGALAKRVKYTKDGLIIWQSCVFPSFQFDKRQYGRNDTELKAALKDPKRAVILEVAQRSHWVVLTGNLLGIYRIADPWDGIRTTMGRYNNDITGAAYFVRKT